MILDNNLHQKPCLWRNQLELLTVLKKKIRTFPIPELSLLFHKTLFDYTKNGIKPLQYVSLEILASLIWYNYDVEEADSILKKVVSEFGEANSSHLKCLFVDFFEICWTLPFTTANIEDKLIGHFVQVSECPFKSVKLRILKVIPSLKYLLTDSDILEEIQSMLNWFIDDQSQDIWIKAEEARLLLFSWKRETAEDGEGAERERLKEFNRREKEGKEIIGLNKVLVEERTLKEENQNKKRTNGMNGMKGRLWVMNNRGEKRRGLSSQRIRKTK